MADGSAKRLDHVKAGDKVTATDPATGKTRSRIVTKVWVNHDTDLMDVTVRSGGTTSVIHSTQHHLFWDDTHHTWVEAGHLKPGDRLRTGNGRAALVAVVATVPGTAYMWDLTVTSYHDFYVAAATSAILVHNCSLPKPEDIGAQGSRPNIRVMTGGRTAAQQFFDRYAASGTDVTPPGYGGAGGGKLVQLLDGSYVGIRYVSSRGDPVVDINGSDGPWRIHFGS